MEFKEYLKPDTHTVGFLAKSCISSVSPGVANEKIRENDESVGDEDEFNW